MKPVGSLPRARVACGFFIVLLACSWPAPAQSEAPSPGEEAALRDYLSANGMLSRGLYELAAAEYRKFLAEHGEHEKALVARYGLAVCLFRMKQHEESAAELDGLARTKGFEYAAEVEIMRGQCRTAAKQYGPAAEAFTTVLERHAEHDLADDAAAGLLEVLYLDGKPDAAIARAKDFAGLWEHSPVRGRMDYFIALSLIARQDYPAAAERLKSLIEADPKGPLAVQAAPLLAQCREQGEFERGRGLFDQGQFEAAQASFEKVADQPGDMSDDAAYWAAKCMLRRGEFAEAARRFAQAAKQFPESALLAEMHYDQALALLKADRPQDALSGWERFRSRFPEHVLAAEALYLIAATEHQRKQYPASQSHCREFLKQYPAHERAANVAFLLAENETLSGKDEAALEAYRQFLDAHPQDPQAAAARFRMGMACYHLERFDEAIPLLRESAKVEGKDEIRRPALLALGDTYFQRSEWANVEATLGEYVAFGDDAPSADDALLKLGLARHRQEKYPEALGSYERLIQHFGKSPHRIQALFERGQALAALNKPEEAAAAFEKVLAESGDSRFASHALNHLGAIALQRNEPERAAEFFDRLAKSQPDGGDAAQALLKRGEALMAAGQFKPAEESFARLVKRDPSHELAPRARAQQAIALSRLGNRQESLRAIQAIEQASFTQLDVPLKQAILYEKAWCLRETGSAEKAAEAYQALIDGDETLTSDLSMHAALELAELEAAAKRHGPAAKLLRRLRDALASDTSPARAGLREQSAYRLGVCEFESEKPEDAVTLFEELIERFPQSPLVPSARLFAGEALFKLRLHDRAATHLTRLTESFKEDPAYGPALLRLGECLAAQQKWPRSEQVFATYLERFGDSENAFQARFGMGWARENQSRFDEAISAYRDVVARHQGPTAARAQFQIGECLFAKKQYAEAARELIKVDILYAYPEWSAAALFEAGRSFEKLSKTGEAREQFRAVQDKYPETPWAKKAAEELAATPTESLPGR